MHASVETVKHLKFGPRENMIQKSLFYLDRFRTLASGKWKRSLVMPLSWFEQVEQISALRYQLW